MPLRLRNDAHVMLRHDIFGQFHQRLRRCRADPDVKLIGGQLSRRIEVDEKVDLVAAEPKFNLVA